MRETMFEASRENANILLLHILFIYISFTMFHMDHSQSTKTMGRDRQTVYKYHIHSSVLSLHANFLYWKSVPAFLNNYPITRHSDRQRNHIQNCAILCFSSCFNYNLLRSIFCLTFWNYCKIF